MPQQSEERIRDIIHKLNGQEIMEDADPEIKSMTGTTEGLVYIFTVNKEPKYVLKLDQSQEILLAEQWLHTYRHCGLPPKLVYADPAHEYIVYTYTPGTTFRNRGVKSSWLRLLAEGLLNGYEPMLQTDKWGYWLGDSCQTWREFIERGVEYARKNVGDVLPAADYEYVKSMAGNTAIGGEDERFLLHGDCGVHNFVFHNDTLSAVIDPCPIAGPVRYDFLYAFCSSPDDLNLETFLQAFQLLVHESMETAKLIEEVIIQLYCRIGICRQHHPEDLEEYLKAWEYWKDLHKAGSR
ncbi:phosphotransferase [Paenibacillus nasutitermitis]|uniref:Aminoglycoside phosphotransferase n=1 Tax=Paenibacillus nasutitermitis TaxID=1652958 RepID=A0A917DX06_9BACL|nr:phosphotransferase [Paenibacillus nasutitermitis]GGD79681.1 aminoglycoside phosphotransferase [Paenibacillus nasutitermitis]